MNKKRAGVIGLLVLLVAITLPAPAAAVPQSQDWVHVQNGAQRYALAVPRSAAVTRYDPEGILHVVLPQQHQTLIIQVHDNPDRLSARAWVDTYFPHGAMRIGEEVGPTFPVIRREKASIGGKQAETFVVVGPKLAYRRIVLVDGGRTYVVSHPVGHDPCASLFEQIVSSLELGDFNDDRGFQVIETDPAQTIASLPVPHYSQRDPQWVCDQLGTCNCDFNTCTTETFTGIGDAGCFISSKAMIFEYYTANHYRNPQEYDNCLTNHGEYTSWAGCAYGLCGAYYWRSLSSCRPGVVSYHGQSDPPDFGLLDSDLSNGYPVIAWVDGGKHYVVVIGKSGGKYQINDPYYSRTEINPGEILEFMRYHGPMPDAVAPTTEAIISGTLGQNDWYISEVEITLTASDNPGGSGVDWIKYKIDDGNWQTHNGKSVSFTISDDGSHTVKYYAKDNFGNEESAHSLPVPIDTTAPSGSFTMNNGAGTTYATLVRVDSLATDATSGVWQIRLRDAGDPWEEDWDPFKSSLYYLLPAENQRVHTVEVQVRDYAGNESARYAQSIYLDLHPPRPASSNHSVAKSTLGMSSASHRCTDNYCLGNTGGQPSGVTEMASANYNLALGYWRLEGIGRQVQSIYLPLILK